MDIVKRVKEANLTEKYVKEPNLIEQLKEQTRDLSKQVKSLEQYKNLCEERIKELLPGHPMPVQEEHLGITNQTMSELQFAKQKISRLESQMISKSVSLSDLGDPRDSAGFSARYGELSREKTYLEESLRAEMLRNEEQRAYIEILKQTLEECMEDVVGFSTDHEELKQKAEGKAKIHNTEAKRDFANLKNTALDQEVQIEKLKNYLNGAAGEMEKIRADKEQLEKHLKEAAEALQGAEDEVIRVEEEKTSLLEYIDEHSQKEQEMEREMNELGKLFEEMKENYQGTVMKLEREQQNNEKMEDEIHGFQRENTKLSSSLRDLQQYSAQIKQKLEEKEENYKRLKEENFNYEAKNESLYANIATLSETLKETQQENEGYQSSIEKHKRNIADKEERIKALRGEIASAQQECSNLKNKLEKLESERETEIDEKLELERIFEEERKNLHEFKAKCGSLEMKCNHLEEDRKGRIESEKVLRMDSNKLVIAQAEVVQLKDEIKTLQSLDRAQKDAVKELNSKANEMSREKNRMFLENQKLQSEIVQKSQENEVVIGKIEQLSGLCDKLQQENKLLEKQIREEKMSQRNMWEELTVERQKLEETSKNCSNLEEILQEFKYKHKISQEEIEHLSQELSYRKIDVETDRNTVISLQKEIESKKYQLELKDQEILDTKFQISQCCTWILSSLYNNSINFEEYFSLFTVNLKKTLNTIRDTPGPTMHDLLTLTEHSIDEIKYLVDIISDLKYQVTSKNTELNFNISRLDGANVEVENFKQQVLSLTSHINSLTQENKFLTNNSNQELQKISSLMNEVKNLRSELEGLDEENYNLKVTLQQSLTETHKLKINSESVLKDLKSQEQENHLLKTEKLQLENLLTKQQERVNTLEMKNAHNDLAKVKGELEFLERERLNIECHLLKMESDSRNRDTLAFRELSQKLIICERQIQNQRKFKYMIEEGISTEDLSRNHRNTEKYNFESGLFHSQTITKYNESPPIRDRSAHK